MDTASGTQLGRYQILKQLAVGGVADVLLARTIGLEGFTHHVVIKRIRADLAVDDHFVKTFLDEARIAASLHHHNIVQVHDIGEQDGAYYFAMEYVHSEDARKLLLEVRARNTLVPIDHVISIVSATAAGLHHAHEQVGPNRESLELVHRDVSPANILIGYDGGVKLVDFGLAKAAMRSIKTRTGTLKGKASYMSPEQCMGRPVDRRSDTFGLGIVLYELATARRLFKGRNDFVTMAAVVSGEIPPPSLQRPDLPPRLDEIILRALSRSPESRYQTADSLRAALEDFAVDAQLRTSNKALADYMASMFGHRGEPWQEDSAPLVNVSTDFDASSLGLVQPPARPDATLLAQLAPRSTSPIMIAVGAAPLDTEWQGADAAEPATVDAAGTAPAPADLPDRPDRRALADDDSPTTISEPLFEVEAPSTLDYARPPRPETVEEPTRPAVGPEDPPAQAASRAASDVVYVGPPAPVRYRRWIVIGAAIVIPLGVVALVSRACGGHAPAPTIDAPAPPSDAISGAPATDDPKPVKKPTTIHKHPPRPPHKPTGSATR